MKIVTNCIYILILAILSCQGNSPESNYKPITISPKPENLQSPQKIREIKNKEWREIVSKNFEVDEDEYKKLIARYGKGPLTKRLFLNPILISLKLRREICM